MTNTLKFVVIKEAGRRCLWCVKAVTLLDSMGAEYSIHPLEGQRLLKAAQDADMTTIPIIYQGKNLIGGYQELLEFMKGERNGTTG